MAPSTSSRTDLEKEDVLMVERLENGPVVAANAHDEAIDKKLERRLKRKLDFVILPILAGVYFLAQMGRSDLANAKVAGMAKDIGLTPKQYSDVASSFLIGYIVMMLPGTLLVRKFNPPFQFAGALIGWGGVTVALMACRTYAHLMGLRFLIGAFEAFVQGAAFYLSFWYTYNELAVRIGFFYSNSATAGAFNGLIAYAIQKTLEGKNNLRAWQWLFMIEGILSIGFSLIVVFMLPSTPERGRWLFTQEEIDVAIKRSRATDNSSESKLRWKLLYKPLVDLKFWLLAGMLAGAHFAVSSVLNFLPDIIHGFGYTAIDAQLMSVLVYGCAFIAMIFWGWVADRTDCRGGPLIVCSLTAGLGYILLLTLKGHKARLGATCILVTGIYPAIPLTLTWSTVNMAGYTKRGASMAMLQMISQSFSISGAQAYIDPPLYRAGNASAMSLIFFMGCCAAVEMWYIRRLNAKKAAFKASLSTEEYHRLRESQHLDIVGDDHIDFVYKW